MVHKAVFVSVSSQNRPPRENSKAKDAIKEIQIDSYCRPTIVWFGSEPLDDFLTIGDDLGIHNIIYEIDLTGIVNASGVVFYKIPPYRFQKMIQQLNFAVNYGIPTFWVDDDLEPRQWIFSFTKIFVGPIYAGEFWKEVGQWIM